MLEQRLRRTVGKRTIAASSVLGSDCLLGVGEGVQGMSFLFFLSYSGVDGNGVYVGEFFKDLSEEIRRSTDLEESRIGFAYGGMRDGTQWRPTVAKALATCRVFVPLYSPRYFRARFCGQEWGIFAERLRAYEQEHGTTPDLIVPVLWEDVFDDGQLQIPRLAEDIWARSGTLGDAQKPTGVRRLVQQKARYRDEYHDVVYQLVARIRAVAAEHELPAYDAAIDFDTAADVFRPAGDGDECLVPRPRPGEPGTSGPRHVHLVVAAPTATEAAEKRTDVHRYGTRSEDWMPYLPEAVKPVVRYAMTVADEQDLTSHPVGAAEKLPDLLADAESANELVVLLVDAWATLIPAYVEALAPYDDGFYGNCAVLVPWNPADEESTSNVAVLKESVTTLFAKNIRVPHPTFHHSLRNVDEFTDALRQVLIRTQKFVFEKHPVPDFADAAPIVARPILDGPGAG
ncbi:TIR-like protein FxsC [Micromonospora sp. WMMD975]|uniref:TIR-like protein FxsC n=1 Tax=Micromonospora sp. WMMD975 TaxID=3016087 RepID=UPI00249C7A87|nr:TIR-like protein FxsC [Micromonospora sp. WMMD975]WFE36004.1 TIR-like protein FxsC [Micromonospora sp. WMMD975]